MSTRQISRALVSVYDKTGLVPFAKGLVDLDWELVSSGGTARVLAEAGVPVTDVAVGVGALVLGAGGTFLLVDGRQETSPPGKRRNQK